MPLSTLAAQGDWKTEKDERGTLIESRVVPGWKIREVKATARFNSPLGALVAVVADVTAFPKLSDTVDSASILESHGDTRYRFHCYMDLPWPVSNRDLVSDRVIAQERDTHVVTITDEAVPDALPPEKGFVRILKSHQQWRFEPQTDGTVLVELRFQSDPNDPIPASIINLMSVGVPLKTFDRLRDLAMQPPYAGAKPPYLSAPP